MPDVNFNHVHEVHKLALKHGVSYSLHYNESDNTWYFQISSAAPSENWIGKNRSGLNLPIQETIERLKSYA